MPIKETSDITPEEWARISQENPVRGMTGPRKKRNGKMDLDLTGEKPKRERNLANSTSPVDQIAHRALEGRPSVTTFDGYWAGVDAYRFSNVVRSRDNEKRIRAILGVDPISGLPTVAVGLRE